MRFARVLGAVGRTLIAIGTLLLLFVGYQLWGTGIQEARSQRSLTHSFERQLAKAAKLTSSGGTTATTEPPLPPPTGEAIAVIEIPKIGVRKTVVEGVGVSDLRKGPGHYPDTPMPGQKGNAAIAGHRTTYGAPFYRLNEVEKGDLVRVRTLQGEFDYVVDLTQAVRPSQLEVVAPTPEGRLTLTTCDPRFSARRRLVVTAVLTERPAPSPTTTSTTQPASSTPTTAPEPKKVTQPGLSGDPSAWWPTFGWGLICALASLAIYLLGRKWRPVWAYLTGAPIFLVFLYLFFENVSRLLPPNV